MFDLPQLLLHSKLVLVYKYGSTTNVNCETLWGFVMPTVGVVEMEEMQCEDLTFAIYQ